MASACGKLIVLGEHAVVYGVPAIAVGLPSGAVAQATPSQSATLALGSIRVHGGDGSELSTALEALLAALGFGPHSLKVDLGLPAGCGLGASAAIGVAIARAVMEVRGEAPNLDRVLKAARAWESVFHGNPSGIDAAAAALGGCFSYAPETGPLPIPVARALKMVVALTGPAPSTREMVEGVRRLRERRPELVNGALESIRTLVEDAKLSISSGDLLNLGRLIDLNQGILSRLQVSTEAIERVCALARSAGALGAKLTGAGGGGAVLALCETDPQPVIAAFRREGLECFATTVLATGDAP